ncbi:MAG TPA: hypothetical protein VE269_08870, partial [Gaiellaceae bacterium]|nr:hypothetical protein [Gaiellaceae bacterium]
MAVQLDIGHEHMFASGSDGLARVDSLALRMPPLDVAIRDARRDDAEQVAPLLGELGYPTTPAQFARRFERLEAEPATWIYVAEADGRLVGLAGLRVLTLVERDLGTVDGAQAGRPGG